MIDRPDISLLFDFFVAGQRIRRILSDGMAEAGMRADEYAVYSLLFELGPMTATEMCRSLGMPLSTVLDYLKAMDSAGHLDRGPHPSDGRAVQVGLTAAGIAAQKRANQAWEVVRKAIEGSIQMPIDDVRVALRALDDAAANALARRIPSAAGGRASRVSVRGRTWARGPTGSPRQ